MKYSLQLLCAISLWLITSTSQANTELPQLASDEGLAIIAIYSKGYAERIKLTGSGIGNSHNFGPLNYSQHISIYKLKAGNYSWDRVVDKIGKNSRQTSDLDELKLTFEVTAGKLNYIGLLMYETNGSTFSAKILNRTSIILSILKQDFPQYLEHYQVVNGIYPNDPYITFFLNDSQTVKQGE